MSEEILSRRSVLRGAAVAAIAGVAGYVIADNSAAARKPRGATTANAYGPSPAPSGHLLTEVSQVPLGGGIVLPSEKIVLTRSQAGQVHGFSAVCTHQGCLVNSVENSHIICPCHGSRFDAQTGAVVNGPAVLPLPTVAVRVKNGAVYTT
jgi:Rieske Fe-S protein